METFIKIVVGGFLVAITFFFLSILSALFGALSGLVVNLFFGETILETLGRLGLHSVALWQIGTTAGWLGGFFRSSTTSTK